jgi:hypothetical protein
VTRRQRWLALGAFALVLLIAALAEARPGGGNYYGGGSRSGGRSSGGSGGGDGGAALGVLVSLLFDLVTHYPAVGIPLVIVVLVVVGFVMTRKGFGEGGGDWQTSASFDEDAQFPPPPPPQRHVPRTALDRLRRDDPQLSTVLFEDFLYSLYVAFHAARGGHKETHLEPYLAPPVVPLLQSGLSDVKNVIVGSMSFASVRTEARGTEPWAVVEVDYESNLTEVDASGREVGYYARERWRFARRAAARSRSPDKTQITQCPNCGGALEQLQGNVCAYCKQTLAPGQFDWCLEHVDCQRETRPPVLTRDAPEEGTHLPTVVAHGANERFQALCARDPSFSWPAFQARLGLIYQRFQEGWVGRDWRPIRPYLSDVLFQGQLYWIEEFKRQRLVNRTDGARIVDVQLANMTSDKYFDALTVRLFATGCDYTVDESGKVVSGNPRRPREYSEYWTLIRAAGANRPARADAACPNCGAPLDIGMAGNCQHCRAKVVNGQFDWVLSRIEQDESYIG